MRQRSMNEAMLNSRDRTQPTVVPLCGKINTVFRSVFAIFRYKY